MEFFDFQSYKIEVFSELISVCASMLKEDLRYIILQFY